MYKMQSDERLQPAPPLETLDRRLSLFLDLDGVLAAIEPHPDLVGPNPRRTALLKALSLRLEGRIAIVSGRTIAEIDRICEGAVMTVAGVHGLEMRTSDRGLIRQRTSIPHDALQRAIDFATKHPEIYLENKGVAFAMHYRRSPSHKDAVRHQAHEIASEYGLIVQSGHCVEEVRLIGPNKGDALKAIMDSAPFEGGLPVMLGDDRTDEAAFEAASAMGGFGIRVSPQGETSARYQLEDTAEVMAWLSAFAFNGGNG